MTSQMSNDSQFEELEGRLPIIGISELFHAPITDAELLAGVTADHVASSQSAV